MRKFLLFFLTFIFFIPSLQAQEAAPVTANSGYKTATTSYTFTLACTGANRYAVFFVAMPSIAGNSVSSISYGAQNASLVRAKTSVSGLVRVEGWSLIAPATGSQTVTVTLNAAIDSAAGGVCMTGVKQTSPEEGATDNAATNAGSATDASVAVTTSTNFAWVVAGLATDDGSVTAGQTSQFNLSGALGSGAGETFGPQTPAGAKTMNWTGEGITATWAVVAWGVKPAASVGDIVAVRIAADGAHAQIDIFGLSTGGSYTFGLGTNNSFAAAATVFSLTAPTYDGTGAVSSGPFTTYGTTFWRLPYPGSTSVNASNGITNCCADETAGTDILTINAALSEFIFASDTAITVTVAAGLYTGSNTVTALSVTNNSALTYPKPVGRWTRIPYDRVTTNFVLEATIFHHFASAGQPLAAVKFSCADTSAHTTPVVTVNSMTASALTGDPNTVGVYAATIDRSGLTTNETLTCNFQAYPKRGNVILDSTAGQDGEAGPTGNLNPFLVLYDSADPGTYGIAFAVVNATGLNSAATTYIFNTQAAAETSYNGDNTHSYVNIARAAAACKAYNNATYTTREGGANTAAGCRILMSAGSFDYQGAVAWPSGTMTIPAIIQPMTGLTSADVTLTSSGSGGQTFPTGAFVDYRNVTFSGSSVAFFYNVTNSALSHLILRNNIINHSGSTTFFGWGTSWALQNSIVAMTQGFAAGNGSTSAWSLIRGNTTTGVVTNGQFYNMLGNKNLLTNFVFTGNTGSLPTSDNAIYAFNTVYNTTVSTVFAQVGHTTNIVKGMAFIQNIIEELSNANLVLGLYNDDNTSSCTNCMVWHNTLTGQRVNAAYVAGSAGAGGNDDLNTTKTLWAVRGNMFDNWNIKDDTFVPNCGRTITGITKANPAVVTAAAHGCLNGQKVYIYGVVGMTEVNGLTFTVANKNTNDFQLSGIDSSADGAYVSGGNLSSANPVRVGGWPVGYQVGGYGNMTHNVSSTDFGGEFTGLSSNYVNSPVYGFVNDASSTGGGGHGSGLGNGDYHLTSLSTSLNLIPSGMAVLPFDISGVARKNDGTGAAGAYEFAASGPPAGMQLLGVGAGR